MTSTYNFERPLRNRICYHIVWEKRFITMILEENSWLKFKLKTKYDFWRKFKATSYTKVLLVAAIYS